jgi:hypothetical protein
VGWLLLAVLGIMWVAFLLPGAGRRHSPATSVEDFERRMELLAQAEAQGGPGRWIVTPRKGARFVGVAERKRARARERRRTVFAFLLESIGITFLIGLVPPLRATLWLTGSLVALLAIYVWVLISLKERSAEPVPARTREAQRPQVAHHPAAARHVADGSSGRVRQTFNGLGSLDEGDPVHVVVRPAGDMAGA